MKIKNPSTVSQERSIKRKCLKLSFPYKRGSRNVTETLNTYSAFPGYDHHPPEGVFVKEVE
jgi:hypothetical protein